MQKTYTHLAHMVRQHAAELGEKTALFYQRNAQWVPMSWKTLREKVDQAAKAMIGFGIKPQQMVGIFAQNCPEWSIADFATLSIRGTVVPIYATSTTDQANYLINDAEVSLLFVGGQEEYDKALQLLPTNEYLKRIVAIDPATDLRDCQQACYFEQFLQEGASAAADAELQARLDSVQPDDLVTLIYTSGTTGEPKGVMLDVHNLNTVLRIHDERLKIDYEMVSVCFLPLSHVFERSWSYYVFHCGGVNYYCHNPKEVKSVLEHAHPTVMCAVPRFYEKIHATILSKVGGASAVKKGLFHWAFGVGERRLEQVAAKGQASWWTEQQYALADKLIFSKLRAATGLDRAQLLPCAGAKLGEQVFRFFRAMGLNINYGYGLSETCATVTCYTTDKQFAIGSIGTPMPGVEVKLGENNEILVKGDTVMRGYYKKPQATAEAFVDGWFRTGDAGAFDASGNLYFTERIKDLMKTSNGKYIAPQVVETTIGSDYFIEQVAIIGDERKYVSALIVPAFEALEEYARTANIAFQDRMDLIRNSQIIELFQQRINELQKNLAGFEQVKKFTLLDHEFSIEAGEITPTLKVKRNVILKNYFREIEAMYV